MTLETMQREGRERLDEMHHSRTVPVSRSEQHKLSDQHTAATWKAAQEASQKRIEELEEEVEDLVMEIKEAGEYD